MTNLYKLDKLAKLANLAKSSNYTFDKSFVYGMTAQSVYGLTNKSGVSGPTTKGGVCSFIT